MPLLPLLSELDRKIILFYYEKRDGEIIPISDDGFNEDQRSFVVTEGEYILWELNKRKFTEDEVIHSSWLITCKGNQSFMLCFEADHKLMVSNLFSENRYEGEWHLENGILKVSFHYGSHTYDISMIGNNNQAIHSALQIKDNSLTSVLKVAPLSQAREGVALADY